MKYSEPKSYDNYEIYQDKQTEKYGIRNISTDQLIIKCIFDRITLYPQAKLFLFKMKNKEAVYSADAISKLVSF